MNYRREIDGLRAVAVLPIIFFHAGFQVFSGGFVGVDIFFVISGYLITSIILSELEWNIFSARKFYERRIRRILPALFFVMAASIPFAWILLPPFDLNSFSKSLIYIPLLLSNIFFWRNGGYFETAAELKPLLHTWSLSVEEQYYLVFPVFLMLLWRSKKHHVRKSIALIAVLSLITAQLLSNYNPIANFFLLPTRAWELAIGGLAATYIINTSTNSLFSRQILSGIGLFMISISVFLFNKNTPTPSFYSLTPTIGTALILLFGRTDTFVGKALGTRLLVLIGVISYSAYLWHQPIFAFSLYYIHETTSTIKLSLVALTFFLSVLSWKYIEEPFRKNKFISTKLIVWLSLVVSILFIAFGVFSTIIFSPSSSQGSEARLAKALASNDFVYSTNMDDRKFIKYRIQYENLNPESIVLGSSRTMQIVSQNSNKNLLNFSVSGASIEDDIALADLATEKFNPSTIFVAADPWLFNSNSGQSRWKSIDGDYFSALRKLDKNFSLASGSNPQNITNDSALVKLTGNFYNSINQQKIVAQNDFPEIRDKIRRDGSLIYNSAFISKSQSEVHAGFNSLLTYAMSNYSHSTAQESIFTAFINHYSRKYKIILILSPYHPDLFARMKAEYPVYLEIESNMRNLAKTNQIEIIGSYDPSKVGCDASQFYDGMHPKESCMKKVMGEL